jgi:hypothetical protein
MIDRRLTTPKPAILLSSTGSKVDLANKMGNSNGFCRYFIVPIAASIGGSLIADVGFGPQRVGTFTAHVNSCDQDTKGVKGNFNIISDPRLEVINPETESLYPRVMAKGEILNGFLCDPDASLEPGDAPEPGDQTACNNCRQLGFLSTFVAVEAIYESTNPKEPGGGTVNFCFVDSGEGKFTFPDEAAFAFSGGPYDLIGLQGIIQGNAQVRQCKA